MKKIYTFTLDDSEVLTGGKDTIVKVIAYIVYEKIRQIDYESLSPILVSNKTLKINELLEKYRDGQFVYSLLSEKDDNNSLMYQPVLIDENTFGITINDGTIDDGEIEVVLEESLKFMGWKYKFNIDSILYEAKNQEDESNRKNAIKKIGKKNIGSSHVKNKIRFTIPVSQMFRRYNK